jgi:Tfp pilus assembly protein PilZ
LKKNADKLNMAHTKNWYVHIGDEIFGPVATDVVNVMLRQTRLQFTDFIWAPGLTKWVRIIDVDDFTRLLPPYPASAIPRGKSESNHEEVEDDVADFSHEEEAIEPPPVPKISKKLAVEKKPEEYRTGGLSGKPIKPGLKLSVFPRIKLQGKISIKGHGHYKAIDISEGGVFVAAEESIEIGTEVDFILEAEVFSEKLSMTGVVIRHGDRHDEKGFAIEFMRVNPAYKRLIKDAITKESGKS